MGTKLAKGIGAPSDGDFEVTFADLAHAQLQDKAPALLDHLLGFQVIEKNEDDTHAVGVLGFKIGNQTLFVPAFFLNGELKQNLIYLKNQDLFVPLQDNWVGYLLNRKPFVMGQGEPKKEQELGLLSPDLSRLSDGRPGGDGGWMFGTRQASWSGWARNERPAIERMFSRLSERYSALPTLPEFLQKTAQYGTVTTLLRTMRQDPDFANTVLQFHSLDSLMPKTAASSCCDSKKRRKEMPTPGKKAPPVRSPLLDGMGKSGTANLVNVLHGPAALRAVVLDSDRAKLLRGEILIKDAREVANVAYRTDEGSTSLMNPTESGEYELLLNSGEFRKVLIFIAPRAAGKGYSRVALVVDESNKNFNYFWPTTLWVKPSTQLKSDDDNKLYERLSSVDSATPNKTYTIVCRGNTASTAFKVLRKVNTGDMTELFVEPIFFDPGHRPQMTSQRPNAEDITQFGAGENHPQVGDVERTTKVDKKYLEPELNEDEQDERNTTGQDIPFVNQNHIVITNDDRELRVVGNTLFAPRSAKILALKEGNSFNTWQLNDPGSLIDVEMQLLKAGAESLTVLRKRADYYLDNRGPLDRVQAITALVKRAGLRADDAFAIVDKAPNDKRQRFLIKNNIGYAPPMPEPQMGFDDYSQVAEQYPQDELMQVPQFLDPNPQAYLGKPEKQQVADAAATGQQEIFDTSAISSLVRTSNSDDLISQYLSDLILGLDRVNRIMFMFYWLNEQFRDRYGQENLVDLEDQLKSVSKSLGDLVLFLKQRKVEGSPNFDSMEIELGR